MPALKKAPRDPKLTDAPRGPRLKLAPLPLRFRRRPGASLIDRRKRRAMVLALDYGPDSSICCFYLGRDLTVPSIWPGATRGGHSSCSENIMADRYLEAVQCLNLIAPERFAQALDIADARAGLRSFQQGRDPAIMEILLSAPD